MFYGFDVIDIPVNHCIDNMYLYIIYDHHYTLSRFSVHACKLHQYCLNREPHFFQNTLFAVDRFHWRGHVGCSLDTYKLFLPLAEINSQVNERH